MSNKQITELFVMAAKHPDGSRPYTVNLASEDGTNDGGTSDTGFLQSLTVSSISVSTPTGITLDSSSNTTKAFTLTVSGGSIGVNYDFDVDVTLSDSNVEPVMVRIPVKQQNG